MRPEVRIQPFFVLKTRIANNTDAWCTAEMCTAVIVASLPGLKVLIMRGRTPNNSDHRSPHDNVDVVGSGQSSGAKASLRNRALVEDELELMSLDPSSNGLKSIQSTTTALETPGTV